jgi:hypothetical protein
MAQQPAWRTLAGCPGVTGTNDGPGISARFSNPSGIAVDATGTIYVADSENHVIRKINAAGFVSTVAGTPGQPGWQDGPAINALLSYPAALALDAAGNLYIGDGCVIRKLSAAGDVTTIAGQPEAYGYRDGTGTNAWFSSIGGLALDADDNVYVADGGNYVIRKVSPDGAVSTLAGQAGQYGWQDGSGTNALFGTVQGLALDSAGSLYVADASVIRKVTRAGFVTTWVGQPDRWGYRDGKGTSAWLNGPVGLATDNQGNVYLAEAQNRCIRKVSPDGEVSTLGGDAWANNTHNDSLGPFARFNWPGAIAVDPSGHLLVADSGNSTIRYGSVGPEPRPEILLQPRSHIAEEGTNVTLGVTAQHAAVLTYQWLANGHLIEAATNATLVVSNLTEADSGEYRVAVSDGVGFVLSRPASLQVRRTQGSSPNPLDNWQRLSGPPLTDIHGLAYGNGRYVAIGGGSEWWLPPELRGSVATSTDGASWVKQFPITSECLNDVAFGNGTFVVVGKNGTVFTSTNGLAWEAQTLTPEGLPDLHGIAFDQGIFVAVSGDANGSIWTSADGCDWANRGINSGVSFMAVAAQDGSFIAVGNTIVTSTNGVDWEPANLASVSTNYLGQEITLQHIAWGNGMILAAGHGGSGVLVSSNGLEWQDAAPTNGCAIARVSFANGQFLAMDEGSGGVSTSPDGFEWSPPARIRCGERSAYQPHLRFEQGLFVATGDAGALFSSSDGNSWVLREPQQAMPFVAGTMIEVEGRWFGAGWPGIETTTNGSDWSVLLRADSLTGLAYGEGKLVAVGGNDVIFSSEDGGATWIDRSPHLSYGTKTPWLSRIAFGGGVFVARGYLQNDDGYSQSGHMLCSSNLITWTAADFAGTNSLSDVAYGAGLFVALLNRGEGNKEILTSTNGLSWQTAATFPTYWLNTLAYGNGRFVVGTSSRTTITSSDGKRWSEFTGQEVGSFDRIVFGNGLFLASSSSALWTSPDGVTWTQCAAPAVSYFQTIAAGDGVFFAVGDDQILYRSGPFEIRLGNPRWLPNTSLEWTVTGTPHIDYRIEFSEDLLNWQELTRVTNAPAVYPFRDPAAAAYPSRFYRVITE